MSYNDRFKDAPWYKGCLNEKIVMVGAGGIAGNALFCLTKTIPASYYVIDADTVNDYNCGSQFFKHSQVGQKKVHAITQNCQEQSTANVYPITSMYSNEYMPIMISGLDNMKARKQVFDKWKSMSTREIYIEGRLRASLYEIYVVTPGREEEYEKTLFDDSEVDEGPCTFKQTAYFGMLIGARITHVLVNYLTNKYSEDPVCEVPYKITEIGEPFYFETQGFEKVNTEIQEDKHEEIICN